MGVSLTLIDAGSSHYNTGSTTNYLRSTGVLSAYESCITRLISQAWPAEKSVYEHAAYLMLKWQAEHVDEIALSKANYKKTQITTHIDAQK